MDDAQTPVIDPVVEQEPPKIDETPQEAPQNAPEKNPQEIIDVSDKQSKNSDDKPWQWKPGQSGNPHGRPKKGLALTDVMRQMFSENDRIPRAIVTKLLEMAVKGDIAAIREVLDRIEGKPTQKNEVEMTQMPTPLLGVNDDVPQDERTS